MDEAQIQPHIGVGLFGDHFFNHAAKYITVTKFSSKELDLGILVFTEVRNYEWALGIGISEIWKILLLGDVIIASMVLLAKRNYRDRTLSSP